MSQEILPGVWKLTLGQPETATPVSLRYFQPAKSAFTTLPDVVNCPIQASDITWKISPRGSVITLPLEIDEHVYGLGIQLFALDHRGKKKTARVNSDPKVDLGDSHAPVPFYVSTKGYGIFFDTARYATFYFGAAKKKINRAQKTSSSGGQSQKEQVIVEVPNSKGIDIYIFAGPEMLNAIQRYNLFSGGGFVPPRWGLGFWYRCKIEFTQHQVITRADEFKQENIPCDVIGLEPAWQTHSYSASFTWSNLFPNPVEFLSELKMKNIHINLWSHAFTHVSSPIYAQLFPYSGDYEVWEGLVPDLTLPETQKIMAAFFEKEHVNKGISGYKLDECDNSDFNQSHWSFPEVSLFPSGLDGEQMHSFMGLKFQEMVESIFRKRNQRTYGEVRSSHALAAPFPYVLYSDLYDHQDFIRGLVNSGFSGLLWCPEVRHAVSEEDLIRRLQSVIFSPQALINAFYITHLPWKQFDTDKNNSGEFLEHWHNLEAACRKILQLRMQLIPYLYSAFYAYFEKGIPPFRALVCDNPQDSNTWKIDDQILVGDRLMVAPVVAGVKRRNVYLPEGEWIDFWTGQKYSGKVTLDIEVPIEIIPLFVKYGSILPLATPTLNTEDPESLSIEARIYGDGGLPISLYEDDGNTYDYQNGKYNVLTLSWNPLTQKGIEDRKGTLPYPTFNVRKWRKIEIKKKKVT
jgi:alpha-D-xyloside xylohydrolase